MRDVAADLDVAEEAEAGLLRDLLERARDGLDVRVVGRDAEAHEPPRRRQPLEQVDLDARLVAREQRARGVEAGRAGADDGDAQGLAHAARRSHAASPASYAVAASGEPRAQCEQPEPQPPTCVPSGSSSPSSTWNEWPQPHEETAFGLSILNPDSWRPVR